MKSVNKKHQKRKQQKFSPVQISMFVVIGISFVIVIFWLIFSLINQPSSRVPRIISQMAEDYYENYLYEGISKADSFKNSPEKAMEKYLERGFSSVKLRTLLLFDNQKNEKYANELLKYCNGDATSVKFYPDAPYGQKDYHIDYSYSCEF